MKGEGTVNASTCVAMAAKVCQSMRAKNPPVSSRIDGISGQGKGLPEARLSAGRAR